MRTIISKLQCFKIYLFFFFVFVFVQCDRDIDLTENITSTGIRPIIHFTTLDITGFENMIQTNNGDTPWSVSKILPDSYIARYEFRWTSVDDEDYVYFIVWINESKEQAFKTLEEMQKYYTIGLTALEKTKDSPAFVGNLSYSKGHEFIRDNYIVRIHTSKQFADNESDIAKYIDQTILNSQTFDSINNLKPIINEFSIMSNPVLERSKTPLKIQVSDPNDRNIIYVWRFDHSSGYGGIPKDDLGNYYYQSTWMDSSISEIGLTLIAVNDYGFCTDSTIYIKTIKE